MTTPTPDFRALCAELANELDNIWQCLMDNRRLLHPLTNDARTALGTPPPESFVVRHYASDDYPSIKGNGFDGLRVGEDREEAEEFIDWVNKHCVIATPPPEPPAAGEVSELMRCVADSLSSFKITQDPAIYPADHWSRRAATLLEQLSVPTQPPELPTDEELLRTYGKAKRDHCYEGDLDDWPKKAERAATVAGLRAALERWGHG